MKTVMDKSAVAHAWAHKSQDGARTPRGNFYFTGATLYSYGSHFVVAHHMPDVYGSNVVLYNSSSYGNTTSKHQLEARYTMPGYFDRISVPGLREDDVRNIDRYGTSEIVNTLTRAMRAALNEAATTRHIRPATRAGHLSTAADFAQDARRLLTVDSTRKDIGKAARAVARKALRALPGADAFTSDGANVAAIVELASQCGRGEARAKYADTISHFRVLAQQAINAAAAETAEPGVRGNQARYRHNDGIDAVNTFDNVALASALIGKVKVSAADKKLRATLTGTLATLSHACDVQARAETVAQFDRNAAETPCGARAAEYRVDYLAKLADELSALDTADERQARALIVETARLPLETMRRAESLPKAQRAFETAESFISGRHFGDVLSYAKNAAAALQYADASEPETVDLAAKIDALRTLAADSLRAQFADDIAAWRAGEKNYLAHNATDGALIRLCGEKIETSWGADVPADVAPLVWRAVSQAAKSATGKTWEPGTGPRLGNYRTDEISESGDLIAGCHTIRFAELQNMAQLIGLA